MLVMIAVGFSLQQHDGELDARTLLEFQTPFAQKSSRYLSASYSRIRVLISCLASVLAGAQHHPSTSTAFLAKPRRLRLKVYKGHACAYARRPIAEMPRIDGDGFCLAAPRMSYVSAAAPLDLG